MSTLLSTDKPLCQLYDVALLDLDGVVYVGPHAVEHAAGALAAAREEGMRLAFVTNNAARTPQTVAEQLTRLGVPAGAEEIVTSAQAAARLLAERVTSGSAVLLVGAEGLRQAVLERGLRPVQSVAENPVAVIQGYDPDTGWRQLAEASYAVQGGALWVASNTDLTIPTDRGIAPGNGALVHCVRLATGVEPLVAGKPELPMHREAMLRTSAVHPLVVGDRLDTDIEGARRAGVDSLLVLTGVTQAAALILAAEHLRPTFVAADLRGLMQAAPAVERSADSATCGSAAASIDDGRLSIDAGRSDPAVSLDWLRAACAIAWTSAAATLDADQVRAEVDAVLA